ncbi:hypothetical protein TBK1r_75100 [Stieleria magnilauensis]|uniref:Uncharacterized protein n=1 Tax=Stieleria magnilauensis TaxID=2527963 RepID=A0ABX5Y2H8_9BACT|nr:hypothetical protein TBK1r_75100 [Planctomycetes bacterium TBK1r]
MLCMPVVTHSVTYGLAGTDTSRRSASHRRAVPQHSPGSRSAPRVEAKRDRNPSGVQQTTPRDRTAQTAARFGRIVLFCSTPLGNAVKHLLAAGREPSGVSGTTRDRRACALPLTPRKMQGMNASQRCPLWLAVARITLQSDTDAFRCAAAARCRRRRRTRRCGRRCRVRWSPTP